MHLDFGVAWKFLPILLHASLMTIALFVLSQVLGTIAAFFLALARMSPRGWLRRPTVAYIWVVRGTPLLLHLFFVYYAAPAFGITLDAFPAAIIAMSASAAPTTPRSSAPGSRPSTAVSSRRRTRWA